MKPNPRHRHFLDLLEARASGWFQPWAGDSFRFQDAEYPSAVQILNGEGAKRNGGRLNVRGSFPIVYGSTTDDTALQECKAHAKRYGLTVRKPRILVAIRLELTQVLDLRKQAVRRSLGITLKQLREEDWEKLQDAGTESLSQALGRAARDAGAEAVIIPSFAHRGGVNVAYFPKNKLRSSKVSIWEESKLPKGPTKPKKKGS